MSLADGFGLATRQRRVIVSHTQSLRWLSLASLGVATIAYLSVLVHVTSIVGGRGRLLAIVALAFLAAYAAAKMVPPRVAGAATIVALVIGGAVYAIAVPGALQLLTSVGALVRDWLAILSGYTVLAIIAADVWAAAFAPGPIFLSWYLGFRGEYALAGTIAGGATALFMLSGDMGPAMGVLGVLGVAATIGFGELARRRAGIGQADLVVVILAAMLVGSIVVPLVPAEGGRPIQPGSEFGGPSLEQSLIGSGEEITATGSPSLDPSVRFTVSSPIESRWRVDAYDRYTGDGWVQTGTSQPFDIGGPETNRTQSIQMAVRAEQSGTTTMPTIWQPVGVNGIGGIEMTSEHGLRPASALAAGDSYVVSVERPDVLLSETMDTSESYPDEIQERYTQLPSSTPDEVGELTAEIIKDTESTYDAAERVEEYILATNNYSLDVGSPGGDIAYEQLFERDAGYCTYFATTMVAMLRSQDIPARFVTGYSAGEQVDTNEWVVRGMDAHAWVEVYIAGVGWVEFDPTPSDPYQSVRTDRLDAARNDGGADIQLEPDEEPAFEDWEPSLDLPPVPTRDQNQSAEEEILSRSDEIQVHCGDQRALEEGEITVDEALIVCSPNEHEVMGVYEELGVEGTQPGVPSNGTDSDPENRTSQPGNVGSSPPEIEDPLENESFAPERSPDDGRELPSPERVGIVLALGVGAAVGVRRSGVGRRVRHEVALRWQHPRRDPGGAVERAWRRLELHLEETAAPRRPEETARAYVGRLESDPAVDLDDGIYTVLEAYERARFSDRSVSAATARETVEAVDTLIDRRAPRLPG